MSGNKELQELRDMIEVINTSIEINARDEQFYRRSAAASTGEVAKALFLEIADDVEQSITKLRARRQKLWDALEGLKAFKKADQ